MTDFSMANMDYAPVKFMIKCFEANYPESLGLVLVHKAPWIFQGIWKIIRGWLDPVVAGKVHFTNSVDDLGTYVGRDHIPTELGGDEKWQYKYPEPGPDENKAMEDVATKEKLLKERDALVSEYEDLTKAWIHGQPGDAALKAQRTEQAEKLKLNYWQLDPYVRARSLYDRSGVIGEGGHLTYYPGGKTHPPAGGAAQAGVEPASVANGKPSEAAEANGKPREAADPADGEARGRSASGAAAAGPGQVGLGVAAERSRTATPTRGTGSERADSATPSKPGPLPAGHEDDGVD
jgi:CRAL/TRIO domain